MTGTYYAFIPVRDCVEHIGEVIFSILEQTRPPMRLVVIDDGSTDGTSEILENIKNANPGIVKIISTGSKTRDYSRLVRLWNMCLQREGDYHMISAGDIILEREYAKILLDHMDEDPNMVVTSGAVRDLNLHTPSGAGRFVRQSFFFDNYAEYPNVIGYESEILWRAKILGYKIKVIDEAIMTHLIPVGKYHGFNEFGPGMKALGYHPLYVLARSILAKNPRMLWSYLRYKPQKTGYLSLFPADLRAHVRRMQAVRMKQVIRNIFHS